MDRFEYQKQLVLAGKKYKRPRPNLITLPEGHPLYCMTYKGRVAEARVIMAEHLGRPLTRNEVVFYKDDFPLNTDISNLELRDRQYMWDDSVEWGSERDAKDAENHRKGKREEERISVELTKIGYQVYDISRVRFYNKDGTVIYSPFDIYAWSEKYSFLADVKFRHSKGPVLTNGAKLHRDFLPLLKADRLIIIATPRIQDCFIDILDLEDTCIIERSRTHPITVLRIRYEDGYEGNRKLRYIHTEPRPGTPSGMRVIGIFNYPQEDNG